MLINGPKERVKQMLIEKGVSLSLHENSQNNALVVRTYNHELGSVNVHLKQISEELSEQYNIDVSYKKISKGKAGKGHQISFDVDDIKKLIITERQLAQRAEAQAQLAQKTQALEKQMALLKVSKDEPKSKLQPKPVSAPVEAIKQGLSSFIIEQTVNKNKGKEKSSTQNVQYKGLFSIKVSDTKVTLQFEKKALPNWPTTKNLYRHLAQKLGEKYEKSGYNRSKSGTAVMFFSRAVCDQTFALQKPSENSLLMSYDRTLTRNPAKDNEPSKTQEQAQSLVQPKKPRVPLYLRK